MKFENQLIIRHVAGSHSYGTNTPESDVDLRGIFYVPDDGIFPAPEEDRDETSDTTYFNLKKYVELANRVNPNILETLYVPFKFVDVITEAGRYLRDNRELFLSAQAYNSYSGYSKAQVKRMRNHNRWIVNPQPEQPPHIIDYCRVLNAGSGAIDRAANQRDWLGVMYTTMYNKSTYRLYSRSKRNDIAKGPFTEKPGQIREHDSNELEQFEGILLVDRANFNKALDDWKHYWEWKKSRNVKRGELEERFGYDSKYAMHAVRLARQGLEILLEGKVEVFRHDAHELLDIKNGKWTYEEVLEHVTELDERAKDIYDNNRYVVPYEVDMVATNRVYKKVISLFEEEFSELSSVTYPDW